MLVITISNKIILPIIEAIINKYIYIISNLKDICCFYFIAPNKNYNLYEMLVFKLEMLFS